MAISRKNVTEIAITGFGDTVFLRLTGEGATIRAISDSDSEYSLSITKDCALAVAYELSAFFSESHP